METKNITPKRLQLSKVLLWYWLNFHPAEVGVSNISYEAPDDNRLDISEADMLVLSDRGYPIASCFSDYFSAFITPLTWFDINKAVHSWLEGEEGGIEAVNWLAKVKGKPLATWKRLQGAPNYHTLCELLLNREIID